MGMLNVGSLVLGLVAWAVPLLLLRDGSAVRSRRARAVLLIVSAFACATAILLQTWYSAYLVRIEDWSALADTAQATTSASGMLLVGTIALNMAVLLRPDRSEPSGTRTGPPSTIA